MKESSAKGHSLCPPARGAKYSPGAGEHPTHPHPIPPHHCAAATVACAASMSQCCSGHWWSLPLQGLLVLCGLSASYPTRGSWQTPLLRGEGSLGGSRRASHHKSPLAIPICLRHRQASNPEHIQQWMCSQVPLVAGGDKTAPWLPCPAAPAKQQKLGTSARATCSPVCSLGCWGHPGVLLAAAGRAPGSGRRLLASQCCQAFWQIQGALCTSRSVPGRPQEL